MDFHLRLLLLVVLFQLHLRRLSLVFRVSCYFRLLDCLLVGANLVVPDAAHSDQLSPHVPSIGVVGGVSDVLYFLVD